MRGGVRNATVRPVPVTARICGASARATVSGCSQMRLKACLFCRVAPLGRMHKREEEGRERKHLSGDSSADLALAALFSYAFNETGPEPLPALPAPPLPHYPYLSNKSVSTIPGDAVCTPTPPPLPSSLSDACSCLSPLLVAP